MLMKDAQIVVSGSSPKIGNGFQVGHPKYGGRVKGTPNQFTELKNNLLSAFCDSVTREHWHEAFKSLLTSSDERVRGMALKLASDYAGNTNITDGLSADLVGEVSVTVNVNTPITPVIPTSNDTKSAKE